MVDRAKGEDGCQAVREGRAALQVGAREERRGVAEEERDEVLDDVVGKKLAVMHEGEEKEEEREKEIEEEKGKRERRE